MISVYLAVNPVFRVANHWLRVVNLVAGLLDGLPLFSCLSRLCHLQLLQAFSHLLLVLVSLYLIMLQHFFNQTILNLSFALCLFFLGDLLLLVILGLIHVFALQKVFHVIAIVAIVCSVPVSHTREFRIFGLALHSGRFLMPCSIHSLRLWLRIDLVLQRTAMVIEPNVKWNFVLF